MRKRVRDLDIDEIESWMTMLTRLDEEDWSEVVEEYTLRGINTLSSVLATIRRRRALSRIRNVIRHDPGLEELRQASVRRLAVMMSCASIPDHPWVATPVTHALYALLTRFGHPTDAELLYRPLARVLPLERLNGSGDGELSR